MFRASPSSSPIDLFSNVEQCLPLHGQKKLNDPNAWQNIFLDQVTRRIPEERFAELFDDTTGRPNAPLRLLVGMLILKEGFGWSDEELFEAIQFNLLVRRALGLMNLTDAVPVKSTYYLFKRRLYAYQVETGMNLLKDVSQDLTRDQAKRLGVVGDRLRMDSTLLGSNLGDFRERISLPLVPTLQRGNAVRAAPAAHDAGASRWLGLLRWSVGARPGHFISGNHLSRLHSFTTGHRLRAGVLEKP